MNARILASFWLTAIVFMSGCFSQNEERPPNIILFLADDLGVPQISCYGTQYYRTPYIDDLARQGMRFTNAYAAASVCSPTRASLYTGKYPARLHITDFIAGNPRDDYLLSQPEWQKFLPLEEVTIAEVLKDEGYRTAIFGKWHLSPSKTPPENLPYNPDKQGFDEYFITYKPSDNLPLGDWQYTERDAHNVDTITSRALDFIKRNMGSPFFLVISHNSIHDPIMEQSERIEKYAALIDTEKKENNPVWAAMVERLDQSIGRIVELIDATDLHRNTMLIFYSDNGAKHAYASQFPFRAGKGWLYEGGIRVPLIVRWEGVVLPDSESAAMVSSMDFFPTFVEAASVESKDGLLTDGISLMPLLTRSESFQRRTLYWNYPHYHQGSGMKPAAAIRHENYKLIEWYEEKLAGKEGAYELYDLEKDPEEMQNIVERDPDKAEELKDLLTSWKKNVQAQEPVLNQKTGGE